MKAIYGYTIGNTWLSGNDHGWGNGYVVIPKGHKLHGVDYNNIGIIVHGGLTYSESNDVDDTWIIGFDTCHCGDNAENWKYEDVVNETKWLIERINKNDYNVFGCVKIKKGNKLKELIINVLMKLGILK